MHALDGARLKVVRAQKHLQSLKDEIVRYLNTNPYEFPFEDDAYVASVQRAIIKPGCEPPTDLSCILSECVEPLRHSLDYITWELARKCAATPPVCGHSRDIFFPICDNPDADGMKRFRKMTTKYSFPATAASLIQSVQPYNTGYELLGVLQLLSNTDKHCLPLLTIACAKTTAIEITLPRNFTGRRVFGCAITGDDFDEHGNFAFRTRTIPFTNDAATPASPEQEPGQVKVGGQVTVFVSLRDSPVPAAPVERTIEQLVKSVANIVKSFEPFF